MSRLGPRISDVFESLARSQPTAPALQAPGRTALAYAELAAQARYVDRRLGEWGIAPGDIVAGCVASRPEMASACATLSSASTFAPLGPTLTRDGYLELLRRLRPKAVLVPGQEEHALVAAARELELAEIHLSSAPGAHAGQFALELHRSSASLHGGPRADPSEAYVFVTSGTTDRPKLVPSGHDHILHHARVMTEWLRYSPRDVSCHLMPLHLSHGVRNALLVPLLGGQSIFCLDERDVEGFFRAFDEVRPTFLTAGFTIYRELLRRAPEHRDRLSRGRLRFLRIGAGRLEPEEIDSLEQTFGVPALKGLTLTEGAATQDPLPPRLRKRGALGLPVGNEIAVLEAPGRFAERGESGEIVMRGPSVFRGYLDDAQLNASSFIEGWFRTGDAGYLDADGYLVHTGRIKEVINRGGEKFSPQQLDAALESVPGVREAAAFGVAHPTLGEEVVAAVVREPGSAIEAQALIEHARRHVGLKGAPRRIYFVDRLPRNDTGKIRRRELASLLGVEAQAPPAADHRPSKAVGPKLPPLETAIAALFAASLGRSDIGPDDDFFLGGGDSLRGAQLLAQLHAVFGLELPMRVLFGEGASVAGMARVIARMRARASPPVAPAAHGAPAASAERAAGPRRPVALSHTQRRAWFLSRLDPGNPAYNEVRVYRLTGPLLVHALRESLDTIVRRHDILRTVYATIDGEPKQCIDEAAAPRLQFADLSAHAIDREARLSRLVASLGEQPFQLEKGPLARFTLARMGDSEHVLVRVWHHIVADGVSAAIFERELAEGYNAAVLQRPPALPPLPLQYADYAVRQLERSGEEALQRQLAYWKAKLADLPTLNLVTDYPRPPQQSHHGARIVRPIAKEMIDSLGGLGRAAGTTLFMTTLAAFLVLLHRYTEGDDLAVGTPIAGRTRSDLQALIGFFANTLVLRVDLSSDPTFVELLRRTRETTLEAYENQETPFEKLVEELGPARDPSRNPLFQVCFALQSLPLTEMALDRIEVRRVAPPGTYAKFDLTLTLRPADRGMTAHWEYCTQLFASATIERMADHFERLLEAIAKDPEQRIGRISMLSREERQTLFEWGRGRPD